MTDLKQAAQRLIECNPQRALGAHYHAPAIARDYLAKCEEVERLRRHLNLHQSAQRARQALGDTDE